MVNHLWKCGWVIFNAYTWLTYENSINYNSQPCKIVILFSQKNAFCEYVVFKEFWNLILYNVYGEIMSSNNTLWKLWGKIFTGHFNKPDLCPVCFFILKLKKTQEPCTSKNHNMQCKPNRVFGFFLDWSRSNWWANNR